MTRFGDKRMTLVMDKGDYPIFTANDWNCLGFGYNDRICDSPDDSVLVSSYENGEINLYEVTGDNWVAFKNKYSPDISKDAHDKLREHDNPNFYVTFEGDAFYAFAMKRKINEPDSN